MSAAAQVGLAMSGLCLVILAIWSLVTGYASVIGAASRARLRPALLRVRSMSSLGRSELADASLLLAVGLAAADVVVNRSFVAILVAAMLWLARPSVQRLMREERPLFALGMELSSDLVVGAFVPLSMAHLLLGDALMAGAIFAATVALCWPPGGARRVGSWRPAWVA